MLILVVYDDGTHDLIESYRLDYLISTGRVIQFCRSSGWVKVGRDPVRSSSGEYHGTERRRRARNLDSRARTVNE
ncbi:GSU3473 family protein [Geobacter sp. DSM 9736]|uniref:GSU3473 family protein n=1 Tax=Geobacter sp. DSM 9736 TaxID=1277350 RepID=UPI000B50E5A0|nr:hypothetical protein [Geobacter sp. DSM 9736]SNB45856.1 hypothetical protein SAMN06269301_1285 [Geobacter sp. DSM 9736]